MTGKFQEVSPEEVGWPSKQWVSPSGIVYYVKCWKDFTIYDIRTSIPAIWFAAYSDGAARIFFDNKSEPIKDFDEFERWLKLRSFE